MAIYHLKQNIFAGLKENYLPSTTYHLDSSVMNSLKNHIKSLESKIQLLRKEIKEKNTLISSLIPLKTLESKYCEANNLQNFNSRTSSLQERPTESTASANALGKKRQGSIRGKNENQQQFKNCICQPQYKRR